VSNCDLVAARSLIALAASRLALRAPALRAATASLFTQSDGIALSSPGKLDDRFGYNCHCGIIAIDQTQLTQCIFERIQSFR
jgi:hypothetical protein